MLATAFVPILLLLLPPPSHSLSLGSSPPIDPNTKNLGGRIKSILVAGDDDATTVPSAALAALLSINNSDDAGAASDSNGGTDGTKLLYASDLVPRQCFDAESYVRCAQDRHRDCLNLFDGYETRTLRCESLDDESLNMRWRASWVPSGSTWLYSLAGLAGWEIDRRDPDPSKVATFSWRSVGTVFADAFRTGTIALPVSAVEGSTVLKFDGPRSSSSSLQSNGRRCVASIQESIDLIREADAGRLRNRRVAQELASWLDVSRRPPPPLADGRSGRTGRDGIDEEEWAGSVRERVLAGVPGAGPLDVDPNEDDGEGAAAVFVFGTVCAVALVLSYSILVEEVVGGTGTVSALCDDAASIDFGSGYLSECFGPYGDGPFVR